MAGEGIQKAGEENDGKILFVWSRDLVGACAPCLSFRFALVRFFPFAETNHSRRYAHSRPEVETSLPVVFAPRPSAVALRFPSVAVLQASAQSSSLSLNIREQRRLDGFQNRCLRQIVGINPSYFPSLQFSCFTEARVCSRNIAFTKASVTTLWQNITKL